MPVENGPESQTTIWNSGPLLRHHQQIPHLFYLNTQEKAQQMLGFFLCADPNGPCAPSKPHTVLSRLAYP